MRVTRLSLGILLDFRTLTSQLPRGNHSRFRAHPYSKFLIQVNMENIYILTFLYGAGVCASVNIHNTIIIAYLLQTIYHHNEI